MNLYIDFHAFARNNQYSVICLLIGKSLRGRSVRFQPFNVPGRVIVTSNIRSAIVTPNLGAPDLGCVTPDDLGVVPTDLPWIARVGLIIVLGLLVVPEKDGPEEGHVPGAPGYVLPVARRLPRPFHTRMLQLAVFLPVDRVLLGIESQTLVPAHRGQVLAFYLPVLVVLVDRFLDLVQVEHRAALVRLCHGHAHQLTTVVMGITYLATTLFAVGEAHEGPKLVQEEIRQAVDEHNKFREMEGKNLPPLCWNETLARYAEKYATLRKIDCKLEHSCVEWPDEAASYGENVAMCTDEMTLQRAIFLWYNEKLDYSYDTNTCSHGKVCGHYTQVVWCNSTQLGCSRVRCDGGGTYITCNYYPPGNIQGLKPY